MDSAKAKIAACVEAYKFAWSEEFALLKEALDMKRKMLREGHEWSEGSEMMPMYEMSETLQYGIVKALDGEESTWFKSKEGGRWFIRNYPVFSLQTTMRRRKTTHFLA